MCQFCFCACTCRPAQLHNHQSALFQIPSVKFALQTLFLAYHFIATYYFHTVIETNLAVWLPHHYMAVKQTGLIYNFCFVFDDLEQEDCSSFQFSNISLSVKFPHVIIFISIVIIICKSSFSQVLGC